MIISVQALAHATARILEIAGILVICGGVVLASLVALRGLLHHTASTYTHFRQSLARAILLGLEIFVAADIIGTVAVDPTWPNVGVLAVIVAIRTVLSFSLQVEIEGAWPWDAARVRRAADPDAHSRAHP